MTLDDLREAARASGIPGAEVSECYGWRYVCTPAGHIAIDPSGELWAGGTGDLTERLARHRATLEADLEALTTRLAAVRAALGRAS